MSSCEDVCEKTKSGMMMCRLDIDKFSDIKKGGGNCIRENAKKIIHFWEKGWTDCRYTGGALVIDKEVKKRFKAKYKWIHHFYIRDTKNNRIISVSNGQQKIVPVEEYYKMNFPIAVYELSYKDAIKIKNDNLEATLLDCVIGWAQQDIYDNLTKAGEKWIKNKN